MDINVSLKQERKEWLGNGNTYTALYYFRYYTLLSGCSVNALLHFQKERQKEREGRERAYFTSLIWIDAFSWVI